MIEVTLEEILSARNELAKLCEMPLPLRESYTVSKLVKHANTELEDFDQNRRKIIADFESQKPEEGEEDERPSLQEQIIDAMRLTVEIPVNKIDAVKLAKIELSPKQIGVLIPFIEFESFDDND